MLPMSLKTFKIEILESGDSDRLLAFYEGQGAGYRAADRARLVNFMESGVWTGVVARDGARDIGAAYLNREPKYQPYRRLKMPELQDLRVDPDFRRRGAAAGIIAAAEDLVKGEGAPGLGISVGLHAGFGAAQRLYVRLGFVPDGLGVAYDREPVTPGARHPVDDDLTLMLFKDF